MTSAAAAAGVRLAVPRGARVLAGVVVAVAALVSTVAGVVAWRTGGDGMRATADEVVAYQAAIEPLVTEWGRIEIQGMRPAIGDLLSGEGVPPETVEGEAAAWESAFVGLRERMRAVPAPPSLEATAKTFDAALQRYIDAAGLFGRAAAESSEGRRTLIDAGVAAARDGARLYNEASYGLQDVRRRAGLGPTDVFPDNGGQ
ncbi:MAG: hypothetical protein KY443_01485 [Actinobacteria bacterium]|nr:hypothetical protein [Actinomycetota bacterium]